MKIRTCPPELPLHMGHPPFLRPVRLRSRFLGDRLEVPLRLVITGKPYAGARDPYRCKTETKKNETTSNLVASFLPLAMASNLLAS